MSTKHSEVIGSKKYTQAHSVPKKTKDVQKQTADAADSAVSDLASKTGTSKSKSTKRKTVAKRARKIAVTPNEEGSSSAPEKSAAPREPSLDEIRVRAYFLSERRIELAQPADASADWLEARRQLLEEAGRPTT